MLSIDNAGMLAAIEVVSIGTVNATLAEPREIFKHAVLANAAGIVMVHNHTSGKDRKGWKNPWDTVDGPYHCGGRVF